MKIKSIIAAATALAGLAMATPASAAIYTYTMTNNDVLKIDTTASTASFVGSTINVTMASANFATFTGGAAPVFTAVLSALDGQRLIGTAWYNDNEYLSTTTHPQKLIMSGGGPNGVNLWAWWGGNSTTGSGIVGGDYLTTIKTYSPPGGSVPEPGMLGLLAAGLGGVALVRRRRKVAAKAA